MASGNGAHVVHSRLRDQIPIYHLCSYSPKLTYFPPLLFGRCTLDGADLVHTTPDYARFFYRPDVPLMLTFHNYVLDHAMGAYGSPLQRLHWATDLRWLTRSAVSVADNITAVSQYTAELVRSDLGYQGEIKVIPNGVDTNLFQPAGSVKRKVIRVLFSGNPTSRKGAQWLPDIALKLDPGIELWCTGGLRSDVTIGGSRIHYLGAVRYEKMPELYRSVDILILPTVREGHSLAVLEAMASGLPVVSSNCSSLPEQIDHKQGGYLIDVGDIRGYADAINCLASDSALRQKMGMYNRDKAECQFTLSRMVEAYRSIFNQILLK
ncbi:MAG: glycosyltransferase family 4 protein [Sedimenticola sp.]